MRIYTTKSWRVHHSGYASWRRLHGYGESNKIKLRNPVRILARVIPLQWTFNECHGRRTQVGGGWELSGPAGYTGAHYKIKSSNPIQVCGSGPLHCNDIATHVMRSPAGVGDGARLAGCTVRGSHQISLRNPVPQVARVWGIQQNKTTKSGSDLWSMSVMGDGRGGRGLGTFRTRRIHMDALQNKIK